MTRHQPRARRQFFDDARNALVGQSIWR